MTEAILRRSDSRVDVIVAGLGPVGAALAALLGRQGLSVLAIEPQREPFPLPRAAHIDHEVMRIFQGLGLVDAIASHVRPAPDYEFRNGAGRVLMRFVRKGVIGAAGWPISFNIYQPGIEAALRTQLAGLGSVEIAAGVRFEALLRNDANGVAVRLGDGSRSWECEACFLVGCDGASSPVREALGVALDDYGFDEPWLVVDTLAADQHGFPADNLQICDPARPTSFVHMGPGRLRWEFMLLPGEHADFAQRPDFIAALLAPWRTCGVIEVERSAVYRFHGLVARRWRSESVFLAGDAAHQMPPFMGQGLCAGLRDAANLAWKLDRVRSGAPDGLLDSYQAERNPHVRTVVERAIAMGQTVCVLDEMAARQRDARMLAGATAQVPAPMPPLTGGWILPDTPGAGEIFPQPVVGRVRLDDVLGPKAWLLSRGTPPPKGAGDGVEDIALGQILPSLAAPITAWLDRRDAPAVLVRPDRYVFGTAVRARSVKLTAPGHLPHRAPATLCNRKPVMTANGPIPSFSVSHFGLFVFDLDRMVDFYKRTFGLLETDRSVVREAQRIVFLSRDPGEHHQIVLVEGRTAAIGAQLLNQISLRVADLAALREVQAVIAASPDVSDVKPSNHGNAFSIYFRDPEGNRFEVFTDSPFYVEQAIIDPLALDQTDAEIIAGTQKRYGTRTSFQPVETWRKEFADRLGAGNTKRAEVAK